MLTWNVSATILKIPLNFIHKIFKHTTHPGQSQTSNWALNRKPSGHDIIWAIPLKHLKNFVQSEGWGRWIVNSECSSGQSTTLCEKTWLMQKMAKIATKILKFIVFDIWIFYWWTCETANQEWSEKLPGKQFFHIRIVGIWYLIAYRELTETDCVIKIEIVVNWC